MTTDPLETAEGALELAREQPHDALEQAAQVIAMSSRRDVHATAHFAAGLAHRTLANGGESTRNLEQAAELADDELLQGQILRSLAFNYAQAGDHARGEATIERSIASLSGTERELSRLQQAFLLLMRGDHHGALPVISKSVAVFSESGEDDNLELTLFNRALIHMELGDYAASIADLERAYEIGMRLDHKVSAADAALHLSQVLGWKDDVPGAMKWHARSAALRTEAGADNPVADTEHAFVLIQARLMREAEATLRDALPRLLQAGHNEAVAVQGHLLLAEVLTERGAFGDAAEQVALASRANTAVGRYRFDIAAAEHRVRAAAGEATQDLLQSAIATADEMDANGERHAAAMERFRAVDIALKLSDLATAARLCDDTARIVRSAPLWLQVQAWTALASVRAALGNRRGAAAAVRAGLGRLDEYRSTIGATDLRVHAGELGNRLAALGLQLAVASGSVDRVFAWSERLRTASAQTQRATPQDADLADALTQLRALSARLRSAGAAADTALRRRYAQQESLVRSLARQSAGSRREAATVTLGDVQARLAGRVLIEYVDSADGINVVVATATTARLYALEDPELQALIDQMLLAAERIARPTSSEASRQAALASARSVGELLRQALVEPLAGTIAGLRPVVIPAGSMARVPWGMLFDGPVEVAPAATAWLDARRSTRAAGRALVATGPDLIHAAGEATDISRLADATTASSVASVLANLPACRMAHFACHARPRTDSPMFSSLVLDDGELTLLDIEQLSQPPGAVVLAACEGGSAVLTSGDEVIGLAAAFLGLGAHSVIAPMFSVSDKATAGVMGAFHRAVAGGVDLAAALVQARSGVDPISEFTLRSFSCFGTG